MMEIGSKVWINWNNEIYCSEISKILLDSPTDIRIQLQLLPIIGNIVKITFYRGSERQLNNELLCYCEKQIKSNPICFHREVHPVSFNVENLIQDEG